MGLFAPRLHVLTCAEEHISRIGIVHHAKAGNTANEDHFNRQVHNGGKKALHFNKTVVAAVISYVHSLLREAILVFGNNGQKSFGQIHLIGSGLAS